jgi:hypothetical protein
MSQRGVREKVYDHTHEEILNYWICVACNVKGGAYEWYRAVLLGAHLSESLFISHVQQRHIKS